MLHNCMKVVYSRAYLDHQDSSGWHPESPGRLNAITALMAREFPEADVESPGEVGPDDIRHISAVHPRVYLDSLRERRVGYLDLNTYYCQSTYDTALLAATGALRAADHAWERRAAMALVRPPGHHASSTRFDGFCYINNIAVAARYLLDARGASRMAIVDLDAHHGNGTHAIFEHRADVLYISTHHWGIFPGTGDANWIGEDEGRGHSVCIPFLAGAGDSSFGLAMDRIIAPILRSYAPDAILVSLGTDTHYMDPLAGLTLSSPGHESLYLRLGDLANEICSGRIAYFLEGGYHNETLAECVLGVISGGKTPTEHNDVPDDSQRGGEVVENVLGIQATHWRL